jgi:hypothetical protein
VPPRRQNATISPPELTRLAALGWPPDRLRAFFTDTLGAAWATPSADAVLQMADAVADRRERGR